jgi:hypothetical protein
MTDELADEIDERWRMIQFEEDGSLFRKRVIADAPPFLSLGM